MEEQKEPTLSDYAFAFCVAAIIVMYVATLYHELSK